MQSTMANVSNAANRDIGRKSAQQREKAKAKASLATRAKVKETLDKRETGLGQIQKVLVRASIKQIACRELASDVAAWTTSLQIDQDVRRAGPRELEQRKSPTELSRLAVSFNSHSLNPLFPSALSSRVDSGSAGPIGHRER